jgi:tRNA nucleotidyltransferase/poly(A) polymerase
MLRAFRLGAAFSFDLHEETNAAIAKGSMRIQKTAGERIRDELIKLAAAKRSHPYILEMHHTGLLAAVLPELDALRHSPRGPHHHASAFDHTLQAFSELERGLRRPELFFPENPGFLETVLSGEDQTGPAFAFGPHGSKPARLKLALLLHDIGKPASLSSGENEGIHFRGHEARGAEMVHSISGRLRLSKNQQAYLEFMVKHHMNPLFLFTAHQRGQLGSRAVTRFFMKTGRLCPELCLHAIADSRGKPPSSESPAFEAFCRQLIQSYWLDFRARRQTPPLLTGRDLIRELGLSPSPLFATLLSRVETERLAGRLRTRADALAWVKNFLNSEKPS